MKFTEWSTIIIVLILFLEIMGLNTVFGSILSTFGFDVSSNVASGTYNETLGWFAEILGVLSMLSLGGAVAIGIFAKSYDSSLIIAPIITFTLTALASTAFAIIAMPEIASQIWMRNIIAIIFGGMGVAYLWSAIDYFAGR